MTRILVLEDDPNMCQLMAMALEDHGYQVSTASRGVEAVALASQYSFDLIISDIRMEGMNGLEALEQMKQQHPEASTMVVTGFSSEADSLRALRMGVGDYLKKPFSMADLIAGVERLLEQRPAAVPEEDALPAYRRIALWALQGLSEPPELPAGAEKLETEQREAMQVVLHLESLRERLGPAPATPPLSQAARQCLNLPAPAPLGPTEMPTASRSRGLLNLGRALEQAGDLTNATASYENVLRLDSDSREGLAARLALARLARRLGEPELTLRWVKAAQATGLGPHAAGEAALWGGLYLLTGPHHAQALALLQTAQQRLLEVGAQGMAACAWLAGAAWQNERGPLDSALRVLLQPQHTAELAEMAPYLLAPLLELKASGAAGEWLEKSLERLVREAPQELLRLLPALSVAARLAAVAPVGPLEPVLRALAADSDEGVRRRAQTALEGLSGPAAPPCLRVYSTGALEVFCGDERIDEAVWKGQKNKFLLAYLFSSAGRPLADERVVEEFWPGGSLRGKRNLNTVLSILRKGLRPQSWSGELDYVQRASGYMSLNPNLPRWHDLEEIEEALREGARFQASGLVSEACGAFRRASALYRGPYLEGCYMEFALVLRTRLEASMAEGLWQLAQLLGERGQPREACEQLQRLHEIDPCHQEGYRLAMQLLLAQGRPQDAVRLYERGARLLKSELDMEPSLELMELFQRARLSI